MKVPFEKHRLKILIELVPEFCKSPSLFYILSDSFPQTVPFHSEIWEVWSLPRCTGRPWQQFHTHSHVKIVRNLLGYFLLSSSAGTRRQDRYVGVGEWRGIQLTGWLNPPLLVHSDGLFITWPCFSTLVTCKRNKLRAHCKLAVNDVSGITCMPLGFH